jgi:hypothetical protein
MESCESGALTTQRGARAQVCALRCPYRLSRLACPAILAVSLSEAGKPSKSLISPTSDIVLISVFEYRADEIAVTPNQPTLAHRSEPIKRNAEFGRDDVQAIQSNACSVVCYVTDAASVNVDVAREEH